MYPCLLWFIIWFILFLFIGFIYSFYLYPSQLLLCNSGIHTVLLPQCHWINPSESGQRALVNSLRNITLQWRHNGRDNVSNHQPHDCLLSRLFRRRSKKTSKLRITGLCEGNSPVTGEFPAQVASNAENVSIWWRHHDITITNKVQ